MHCFVAATTTVLATRYLLPPGNTCNTFSKCQAVTLLTQGDKGIKGGERVAAHQTIRTLCVGSNTFRVREYFGSQCMLILQQGRKLCLPRQTIPTDAVASAREGEGAGRKRSAGRDGNTAHASVNSRCQYVKLQGVIEGMRGGEREDSSTIRPLSHPQQQGNLSHWAQALLFLM